MLGDGVLEFPTLERLAEGRWGQLEGHLLAHYHKPDLEGVRVALAATASHNLWPTAAPVWLMFSIPSATAH